MAWRGGARWVGSDDVFGGNGVVGLGRKRFLLVFR